MLRASFSRPRVITAHRPPRSRPAWASTVFVHQPLRAHTFVQASPSMQGTEMHDVYVADMDLCTGSERMSSSSGRVSVPSFGTLSEESLHVSSRESGESVALVKQNGELKHELTTVKQQLVQSEAEVEHLTMQLADKERTLQVTKADLIETRLELQRTDERLREVQSRLETASAERGEYRQYLLEAQAELQQTRSELVEWSDGLVELKAVMEGLDGDLSAVFGDDLFSDAVAGAMALTDALGTGSDLVAHAEDRRLAAAGDQESMAQALAGLQQLSADVLRQAEEDAELYER